MKQAISIVLKKDRKLEKLRNKYNPIHRLIKPHLTLAYPIKNINQEKLFEHIECKLKKVSPFKISLKGLKKSAREYYLYLLVSKGRKQILKLHKTLTSGILKNVKNPKVPRYTPHITLGVFKTKKDFDKAKEELSKLNLVFEQKVESIKLLKAVKKGPGRIIKTFKLK